MANPNINTHIPIIMVGTESGNQEPIQNYIETQGKTWQPGSIVSLSSGATIAWSGTVAQSSAGPSANLILGVSVLPGFNYAVTGASAPLPPYGPIGFPGGTPTFGSVINQSAAVNLLHGSPFANGYSLVQQAYEDTIFEAMVDASSAGVYNLTNSAIGAMYGMTVDSSGFWYIDTAKATFATAVIQILSLNPFDYASGSNTTGITNGRARFRFLPEVTSLGG